MNIPKQGGEKFYRAVLTWKPEGEDLIYTYRDYLQNEFIFRLFIFAFVFSNYRVYTIYIQYDTNIHSFLSLHILYTSFTVRNKVNEPAPDDAIHIPE